MLALFIHCIKINNDDDGRLWEWISSSISDRVSRNGEEKEMFNPLSLISSSASAQLLHSPFGAANPFLRYLIYKVAPLTWTRGRTMLRNQQRANAPSRQKCSAVWGHLRHLQSPDSVVHSLKTYLLSLCFRSNGNINHTIVLFLFISVIHATTV